MMSSTDWACLLCCVDAEATCDSIASSTVSSDYTAFTANQLRMDNGVVGKPCASF